LLAAAVPGNTELQATGAAEGAARCAGAEGIAFTVFGSGHRADTVIGRPTNKVIRDGDMLMASFAVQYEGYIATAEYPFVAGKANDDQMRFLGTLFEAANVQLKYLRAGALCGEMVRAVKAVFEARGMRKYDLYPPMHGIGLAEAESPYPDENARQFRYQLVWAPSWIKPNRGGFCYPRERMRESYSDDPGTMCCHRLGSSKAH
jgi:Xaa-Pro aminopeptidase